MRKAVVVVAALLILFISLGAVVIDLYLSKDNVTVSGEALVSGAVVLAATLQTIEFTALKQALQLLPILLLLRKPIMLEIIQLL